MSFEVVSSGEEDQLIRFVTKKQTYPLPNMCTWLPFDCYPWTVLLFICGATIGADWVRDSPSTLHVQLTAWFGGPSVYPPSNSQTLSSLFSYPNLILPLVGGYLLDTIFGPRLAAAFFGFLVLLGQLIFTAGVLYHLYWPCILGRILLALGADSLIVTINYFTARWFDGKLVAFAFCLVASFSKFGNLSNFMLTPIFSKIGIPFSIWFGTLLCLASLVSCIFLAFMDWYGEVRHAHKEKIKGIVCLDIRKFPFQAWLLFLVCGCFYADILTVFKVAGTFLHPKDEVEFQMIPDFVIIFLLPIFGLLVDKWGRSLWCLLIAIIMHFAGLFILLVLCLDWFTLNPTFIMVWFGIAYSMSSACIWPLLPFIIQDPLLGTGYGTMMSVRNFGLVIFIQVTGLVQADPYLNDTVWSFSIPILLLICGSTFAVILNLFLISVDVRVTRGMLNTSGENKQRYKKESTGKWTIEVT